MVRKQPYTIEYIKRKLERQLPQIFTIVEVKGINVPKPIIFISMAKKYKLIKSIGFDGVNIYKSDLPE